MLPDLERLIALQRLETAIADATARIASHPERLAAADLRLNDAKQALERAKQRLKESHDARRALEKDAAVFQSRLTKFKDQLSAVKTNREYQAMQHEIATAQQELGAAEEKVLERMMEGDALAADIKRVEAALAALQKEVDAEKTQLAAELASIEAALKENTGRRSALLAEIPKPLVVLFEQVARARKGVAICTATRDGLCSVCNVRLRPAVFQQVRHNDSIVQCDVCHRILYYVPPPQPVTPPSTVSS
jgi:predicted  nucleic acid-binding Zn-ribbon protein